MNYSSSEKDAHAIQQGHRLSSNEGQLMLRTIGKTFGMAIAGMCLVSTLAMAQTSAPGQTLVCTKCRP
jgi:hypothetical protein